MEILVLVILTLLNGFFALSELSIISVNRNRMEQKARNGSKSAQTVMQLLKDPEDFLSAVQVGITLIGIISGAYGGAALSDDVRAWLVTIDVLAPYADVLSIVVVIGLITYFSIVIGELIPKTVALSNADKIALAVAPVIQVFTMLTMPLVKLLSSSTNLVIKLFGIPQPTEEKMSEEELRQIIKSAGKQGILAKEESELHQNIFTFFERKAKNLKTHRIHVEWLDINQPIEKIKEIIQTSSHTKFPVSDGTFDNIIGVLTAKNFYEYLLSGAQEPLSSILQPPIFISESMLASSVLNTFKKQKQYIGIVIDEFGAIEGIITLHDIMEEIVGDLPNLDEGGEPEIVRREDGSFLVSGSMLVFDLNKALSYTLIHKVSDDYSSLAGFIVHYLDRFPHTGEKFEYNGFSFEIVDMDGARIDKVLLTNKLPKAPQPHP